MKLVCGTCGRNFEYSEQHYAARGLQPPLRCPTCVDRRQGRPPEHTVLEREVLHVFESCDVSDVLGWGWVEVMGWVHAYRRLTIKGKVHGASWSGRIDVFDQRTGDSPIARVRIMRTTHEAGAQMQGKAVDGPCFPWYSVRHYEWEHSPTWEYVVIEDTQSDESPMFRLVLGSAIRKWNREDWIDASRCYWSVSASGASRSGKHSGVTVLAVTDGEHALIVRRAHDRGALNKGDLLAMQRSSAMAGAILARKAGKPVEVDEVVK